MRRRPPYSAFLQILAGLLAPGVRLTVIPVRLVPASCGYGDPWHQESLAIVERAGGAVVPVDNGSAGMTRCGGLSHFRRASAAAAAVTEGILSGTARSLVIAFDAPFYGLAPLLPTGQRARLVNVARATRHCTPPPTASGLSGNAPGCWPPPARAEPTSAVIAGLSWGWRCR
jgi:hypothetical protein